MKQWFFSISIFCCALLAHSQVRLQAVADTNKILIGEQYNVTLSAIIPQGTDFNWPLADSLEGLELITVGKLDTTLIEQRWELQQTLTLSAFDSGYFAFPPQTLLLGTSRYVSEALPIAVLLPELPEDQEVFDIKDVEDVPFNWWWIILWTVVTLLVIAGVILLIIRLTRKKPIVPVKRKEPALPPYEWAVKSLREIEKEQLWQAGKVKLFYSEVTDVVRQYMERALAINAMESTALEIKEKLKVVDAKEQVKDDLNKALYLSEMVKFAKEQPTRADHEKTVADIYAFLEATKPKPVQS